MPMAMSSWCNWPCRAPTMASCSFPLASSQMDAPCCDVFELEDGKIKRFDCYPEGSIILAQLGVLNNLDAALSH